MAIVEPIEGVPTSVSFVSRKKRRISTITTAAASMASHSKTSRRTHYGARNEQEEYRGAQQVAQQYRPQHSKHQPTTSGYERTRRRQRGQHTPLLPAEYLGVSSTAFPRPLRRYIASPLRGRNGLGARALSSVPGRSAQLVSRNPGRRESCTTMAQKRGTPISLQSHSFSASSFSADEDEEGIIRDNVKGSHDAVQLSAAHTEIHRGLLTPVGPDWWSHRISQSADVGSPPVTVEDDGASTACSLGLRCDTNSKDRQAADRAASQETRKRDERGQDRPLLVQQESDFGLSRNVPYSQDSDSNLAMQLNTNRGENSPREDSPARVSGTAGKKESTHRLRRRPVSAQPLGAKYNTAATCGRTPPTYQRPRVSRSWDLLTGRKLNAKSCRNKKGPRMPLDPHKSGADSGTREGDDGRSVAEEDDLAWMGESGSSEAADRVVGAVRRPKRRAWESGIATDPLQYPTPAVRRSVAQFHEKVAKRLLAVVVVAVLYGSAGGGVQIDN